MFFFFGFAKGFHGISRNRDGLFPAPTSVPRDERGRRVRWGLGGGCHAGWQAAPPAPQMEGAMPMPKPKADARAADCDGARHTAPFLIHGGHAPHPYEKIESGEGRHPC